MKFSKITLENNFSLPMVTASNENSFEFYCKIYLNVKSCELLSENSIYFFFLSEKKSRTSLYVNYYFQIKFHCSELSILNYLRRIYLNRV